MKQPCHITQCPRRPTIHRSANPLPVTASLQRRSWKVSAVTSVSNHRVLSSQNGDRHGYLWTFLRLRALFFSPLDRRVRVRNGFDVSGTPGSGAMVHVENKVVIRRSVRRNHKKTSCCREQPMVEMVRSSTTRNAKLCSLHH